MDIYYDQNGEVVKALYAFEAFQNPFDGTSLSSHMIDEVDPTNKTLCRQLATSAGQVNDSGQTRYYISGGELYERESWEPTEEEIL